MTDGEKLQAIFEALPELLGMKRRMEEVLDRLGRPEPARADDLVDADYFARADRGQAPGQLLLHRDRNACPPLPGEPGAAALQPGRGGAPEGGVAAVKERRRDRFEWKTRTEWGDEVRLLCARLNAAGALPQWTPRTLREYANRKFDVLLGLDALTFEGLRRLRDDLQHKPVALEAERRAAFVLAAPAARHALERNASADEAG